MGIPDSLAGLKISCLAEGLRITDAAAAAISRGGTMPISIREYATTGGITLKLEGDVYVNAPFDEWFTHSPEATLHFNAVTRGYEVMFRGESFAAEVLPLPGYLGQRDSKGNLVTDSVMTHADRLRLSPVNGCACRCQFCDGPLRKYGIRTAEQLVDAFEIAYQDKTLPARHVLISGGTPSPADLPAQTRIYETLIRHSPLPVDVMLDPDNDRILGELAAWGVHGLAINLEIYEEDVARRIMPQKARRGKRDLANTLSLARDLLGPGRVRSLLLVGLEGDESVLRGVEFLSRLGVDPVLSPFRPARGTPLANVSPPTFERLQRVYQEAREIVERFGVKLGPRCIPCQHNTLTFPDGSNAYHYF